MDFPQQIEETFASNHSPSSGYYDVIMESPLLPRMERKVITATTPPATAIANKTIKSHIDGVQTTVTATTVIASDKMNSSINSSTLDDTTPSDSGIQMMDSETSSVMVDSITSQTGFDYEEVKPAAIIYEKDVAEAFYVANVKVEEPAAIFDTNSNITISATPPTAAEAVATKIKTDSQAPSPLVASLQMTDDVMATSACSTFDTSTDNIVYRRKIRKTPAAAKAPKKRVSFHEDILKNTRTDNIHIEHGFITYKNGRKMAPHVGLAGRYSWCSEGDTRAEAAAAAPTEICCAHQYDEGNADAAGAVDDADGNGPQRNANGGCCRRRCVVYRNACSDVLDYGNSNIYDTNDRNRPLQYDNSGVFEYIPQDNITDGGVGGDLKHIKDAQNGQVLYRCSCSSSNSSLDSDETDKNSNRQQYGQAKSSSCDCIGMSNAANNNNNNLIGENCYYSEPNIDNLNEQNRKKSVWNKEKKPKSSCLKKTNNNMPHTHVIHEQDLSTKVKKFNVHDMNQLFDSSSKIIIGSLKSIFTMPLPERGVPEGSEDLQAVVECIPEMDQTPEHKGRQQTMTTTTTDGTVMVHRSGYSPPESPPLKAKPFLSKSLDGSKKQQGIKKFVHNVDEQLRRKNTEELYAPTRQSSADEESAANTNMNTNQNTTEQQKTLKRQEEFDSAAQQWMHNNNNNNNMMSPQSLPIETYMTPTSAAAAATIAGAGGSCGGESKQFRNKFIINCESTVFEHTGVSYCYDELFNGFEQDESSPAAAAATAELEKHTPIAQPERQHLNGTFIGAPIAKTFSNFFRSFKESNSNTATTPNGKNKQQKQEQQQQESSPNVEMYFASKIHKSPSTNKPTQSGEENMTQMSQKTTTVTTNTSSSSSSSTNISELSTTTATSNSASMSLSGHQQKSTLASMGGGVMGSNGQSLTIGQVEKQTRHLPSPLKKRSSGGNLITQPARYGTSVGGMTSGTADSSLLTPDLFINTSGASSNYAGVRGGCGRDSKSTILSEEFDDILTITTDTDKNESDIVIVDYPELSDRSSDYANLLLKPPQPPAAKSSLINRFLRNVTQKKILETSIRTNNFFNAKLKSEQKLLTGNLYVPGAKPKNYDLIDDLNAEIAMEIEMSGANSPRRELTSIDSDLPGDISRFELGIGEISIDIFNGNHLPVLSDPNEQLMKVFKLYTGYSREGFMTPVLVFLTDRTLYVTDLVRNRLCTKFMLAYNDLDVILMGPYGNTVLLSNSERDMQQVLLAGGPYPADGLVANLEMCARRGGSTLPAVGQLTLGHLAPLQKFVCENSCVGKGDTWMYYAVVNVPAGTLGNDQEPLGPHIKGFLMHRRIKENSYAASKQPWNPGYFLLKAGVLYMFNNSTQKLPTWAMALAECQGARRSVKAGRPHCFEIILKGKLLQLAAPDEYVASEWLQALLQSASGLFEMQEKHKTLGCTLVVTENHLITLHEDFTAPLRQINRSATNDINAVAGNQRDMDQIMADTGSLLSSAMSTPTRGTQRSCSSMNSTPTKLSLLSRSTTATISVMANTNSTASSTNTMTSTSTSNTTCSKQTLAELRKELSTSNMSSVYGKNSGIEILTCADIKEMTGIKIPSHNDTWWCILEFSCQEVRECSDDLVIFFASSSEMQRFLRLLEQLWQAKNNDLFPITILDEDDMIAEQCSMLYMDINRSWEPLLSAALGYPL